MGRRRGVEKHAKKTKRRLLVSAALVASLGMLPQFNNSAQADETTKNDLTPKCLLGESVNDKKSFSVKKIDKIVAFNQKNNTLTGFAVSVPQPTRGNESAYTWSTTNNGQIPVIIDGVTYYTNINDSSASDYVWDNTNHKFTSGSAVNDATNGIYINNTSTPISNTHPSSIVADFIGNGRLACTV